MKLEKAAVLVTGASGGLGRALAIVLARRGAKVVLVARSEKELENVRSQIEAEGGVAFAIAMDVADKDAVHRVAGGAAALAGPIDILVHNASTLGPVPLRLLLDTDCEDFERAFLVNTLGPFRLTKAIAGGMALRERGIVVGITSDAAMNSYETWGAYGATKIALEHMLRTFGAELARFRVRFVAIDPGEMNTKMHRDAIPDADPATLADPLVVAEKIAARLERGFDAPYTRVEIAGGAS